nr:MAG TPA: hypothetical protein [Bacteriophage sp.]
MKIHKEEFRGYPQDPVEDLIHKFEFALKCALATNNTSKIKLLKKVIKLASKKYNYQGTSNPYINIDVNPHPEMKTEVWTRMACITFEKQLGLKMSKEFPSLRDELMAVGGC